MTARLHTKCPECQGTGTTWTHDGLMDACWRCTVMSEVEYQTYEATATPWWRPTPTLKEAA